MSRLFRKTLLIIVILFGFYANSASIYSAWVLYKGMAAQYRSKAVAIAKSISSSSAEIFLNRDAATIQSVIDQFGEIEGVSYILVEDSAKEIVSHTFIPKVPDDVLAILENHEPNVGADLNVGNDRVQVTDSEAFLDISIGLLGGLAGRVHVGMDKQRINSLIWRTIVRTQLISLLFFLITIGITYLLIRSISRPISSLRSYAMRVAAHDFSAALDIQSKDEIGDLARSMSSMSGELQVFISRLEASVEQATTELKNALAYQTAIVENLTDGLVVIDDQGLIISSNRALQHMLAEKEATLKNRPWRSLFDHSSVDAIERHLHLASSASTSANVDGGQGAKKARSLNVLACRTDGSCFPAEISFASIQLQDRSHDLWILRDVTRQREMDEALRKAQVDLENRVAARTGDLLRSNEQLELEIMERHAVEKNLAAEKELLSVTMRSIADGVVTTDTIGRISLMNPVAERILGVDLSHAMGQPFSDLLMMLNRPPGVPYEDPIGKVLATGQVQASVLDFSFLDAENEMRHVAHSAAPIFDTSSQIIGAVMVMRDQTEQRRLEAQIVQADKLDSIGVLAGGIAHDFNNILNIINGNIELARLDLEPSDEMHTRLGDAHEAIIRAKDLTQQLLTFSKGGAPQKKSVSVTELLGDAVQFAMRGSNVKHHLDLPSHLWPVEVDTGQINQVISNLAINAMHAMPDGGNLTVSAENVQIEGGDHPFLNPGRYVKIEMRDEGAGIPQGIREKIIDPYFTTKPKGSGLGLAVVYSIIRRHGGFINFVSEPGEGTTFYFFLPAASVVGRTNVEPDRTIPTGKGKLLVMDDEEMVQTVAVAMLERVGYVVETALDGQAAVECYRKAMEAGDPFDAVIMDLTIPGGMGGKEALKRIAVFDASVKAIVSSGYSNDPVMANPSDYGFCGVVAKPYQLKELSEAVQQVLQQA